MTTNTKLKRNFVRNHFKDYTLNEKNEKDKEIKNTLLQKDFLFQKFENSTPSLKSRKNSFSNNAKNNTFTQNQRGVTVNKGDEMGRFNMGSTVVVIFEAEPNFKLDVTVGDRVVYGQRVGAHYDPTD